MLRNPWGFCGSQFLKECFFFPRSLYGGGGEDVLMPQGTNIFTARKRSLGQGYIFRGICHSVNGGGVCLSACWDTPLPRRHPLQGAPLQGDPPCQGDSPPLGPHPGGKLRGIRSRPTAKGEIEGDQIQAHTQGGN